MVKGSVRLSGVTKQYTPDGRKVLNDVSFSVSPGEMIALTGKSGSGKTTLLNMIGGLDVPTSGKVEIGDFLLTGEKESVISRFRAENIGFVFQFFNLIPELTVKENILFQTVLRGGRPDEAKINDLLSAMEISDLAGRFPAALSGGEQQRVAIARALYSDPQLLLLDEPTGNLDEASSGIVMDLIKRANKETGVTVIYVTHDSELAGQANRIIRLRDGKIRQ